MVVGSMVSLINTTTCELMGTVVWALAGLIELTVVLVVFVPAAVVKLLV